jgi:nucleoside-diphosphate-sugar epimerase
MRIAVTGAAGFMGRHLVRGLCRQGHTVHAVGRDAGALERALSGISGCLIFEDFEGKNLGKSLDGVEAVVHLAARRHESGISLAGYLTPNVLYPYRILRAAQGAGCAIVILASSIAVYRPGWNPVPFREDGVCLPATAYGRSKLMMEWTAGLFNRRGRIRTAALRLAQIYGPGMRGGDLLSTALERARRGLPVTVWGQGKGARDYLYVSDAVEAVSACLGRPGASGAINVGSGVATTHLEAARIAAEAAGNPGGWRLDPERREDPSRWVLDIGRARAVLGWVPRRSLAQGLREMLTGWVHAADAHE